MKRLSSLSIFFPALNDAKTIPFLVARAEEAARRVTHTFEIIVINDGSTDDTANILLHLQHHYPRLRVVTHRTNRGYGAALRSGFRAARYDWIFYTDGDGQYDPTELTRFVAALGSHTDVVNGYQRKRADNIVRVATGRLYNAVTKRLFRPPIRDIECDFRLIRTSKLREVALSSNSGTICIELIAKLAKAGARFVELPVSHYPRQFGRSQFFRLRHIAATLKEYKKQIMLLQRKTSPHK